MDDTLILIALVGAAFVSMTTITLVVTTPVETPAKRLARYARYNARKGAPGALAEPSTLRERLIEPLARSFVALVERTTPSRMHKVVAAELTMAGSHMSP